ncbi:MAG: hypothetical protein NTV31_07640, partial [Bacteroidia bacterium]|nr:hypothetical protein [Bacteroidia bacterium]
ILGAVGVICYVAGLLFKIQHWPLATTLMILGVFLLCILAFPWYTYISWREEGHVSSKFLFMIIGFLLIIVPGAMVNLNLQNTYERGFYPQVSQQQAVYNYLYRNNNSLVNKYHDSINYPQIEQLHSRTASLLKTISNIQVKMVQESEGKPGMPAISDAQIKQTETGLEIQYNLLSKPFHPGAVKDFLLPGCSSRQELDAALADYNKFMSGLIAQEDLKKFLGLLEPSVSLPAVIPEDGGISLISGLNLLELLKNSVLSVESYVLTTGTGK